MNKTIIFLMLFYFLNACNAGRQDRSNDEMNISNDSDMEGLNADTNSVPRVLSESTYPVLEDLDITFAEGLAYNGTSTTSVPVPLKLDMYYPDSNSTNRPVFMFIHGGSFKGGTKTKPEIIEMARYYAARGWVFASIDYRTTEELCYVETIPQCERSLSNMSLEQMIEFYQGIVPQEWIESVMEGSDNLANFQQALAMYTTQRDAKAALRWIVANASNYEINTDYIAVGGASAGAITTVALGISNQEDFRDEMSVEEDPTLTTTNLDASYNIKSIVYFWGSKLKLDVFEMVYGLNRYDSNDPELFMAHGTGMDLVTPYEGSLALQEIYNSLNIYSELATITQQNGNPAGHGAWNGQVDGKGLSELSFDFLVERQELVVE